MTEQHVIKIVEAVRPNGRTKHRAFCSCGARPGSWRTLRQQAVHAGAQHHQARWVAAGGAR